MEGIVPIPNPVPSARKPAPGDCQCGCGRKTSIARQTDPNRGWSRGEPVRYIRGHHGRKATRYIEVDTGYLSPCWIWQLAKLPGRYGLCWHPNRGMMLAHRHYYEQDRGPIPADRQLHHRCEMPPCVNPAHLEPVTAAENIRRGASTKLTAGGSPRGSARWFARWSW